LQSCFFNFWTDVVGYKVTDESRGVSVRCVSEVCQRGVSVRCTCPYTSQSLRESDPDSRDREPCRSDTHGLSRSDWDSRDRETFRSAVHGTHYTCFTGTKIRILTERKVPGHRWVANAKQYFFRPTRLCVLSENRYEDTSSTHVLSPSSSVSDCVCLRRSNQIVD
jgi:hypothetical protein